MVEPPKPLERRVDAPKPTVRSVDGTIAPSGTADNRGVSVAAARPRTSQLRPMRERIQIVGDANAGKSWVYYRKAAMELAEARQAGRQPAKFFVIDLDDGASRYLNPGCEFHGLYCDDGGNMYIFPCDTWGDVVGSIQTILKTAKLGDWVIIDPVNKAYDMCVITVGQGAGINVVSETFERILSNKGFGAFDTNIWNAVSVIFNAAINSLMALAAHIIFVQHLTDYVEQRSNREVTLMFDQVGVKPQGAKNISKMADTVVFLWTVRAIFKDQRGKRTGSDIVRKMTIVKDRGRLTFADLLYDKEFFTKLEEARSGGVINRNVTDPDEADRITRDALAQIRAAGTGTISDDAIPAAPILPTHEVFDADELTS